MVNLWAAQSSLARSIDRLHFKLFKIHPDLQLHRVSHKCNHYSTAHFTMPRTKKKRGRFDEVRERKENKHSETAEDNAKRRKLNHDDSQEFNEQAQYFFEDTTADTNAIDTNAESTNDEVVFHGLLDDQEQSYYANVNTKIVANDFEDEDEKVAFVNAVYRESSAKEMKLASSQSCSRYLERLLKISNAEQLRDFLEAIMGGLTQLMQHRFGSHVCETLFLECAKHVTSSGDVEGEEGAKTVAGLLLQAAKMLQGHIGYMLTDKFASHTIRILLLVLSGESLDDTSSLALVASKRKEKVDAPAEGNLHTGRRQVPKLFKKAMADLMSASVASLDTTYLRALATHPTGNPVLQLLLQLELTNSDRGRNLDHNSLFNRLIEPDKLKEDSDGAKFISGITYDPTGSRLIEILVRHSPAKIFKKIYQSVWQEKMRSMAKNDIANYVAIKILDRIGKDELETTRKVILEDLALLIERKRFTLLKTLVERSVARELDLQPVADAFKTLDADSDVLDTLLYSPKALESDDTARADVHGSILAQAMLEADGTAPLIRDSLSALSVDGLLSKARDPVASRVVQLSLTSSITPLEYRKRMIPRFYGHLSTLAMDSVGSFTVDALWQATNGIHFMKERLARELADNEAQLRDSHTGRKVWRNWSMDLYTRRRSEWHAVAKGRDVAMEDGGMTAKTPLESARERKAHEKAGQLQTGAPQNGIEAVPQKTPIELARQRNAEEKKRRRMQAGT